MKKQKFDEKKNFFFLQLIVGYSNNRLYLLSNKNGHLKYLTSITCPGIARRIIYDKTSRDIIYVGGDKGLFVRWYLVREIVNIFK